MYNILYKLYFIIQRKESCRKEYGKAPSRLNQWLIGHIEAYYNIWIKNKYTKRNSEHSGVTRVKREQGIIVSLTSYPKRIQTLWMTIETLLRQTKKPDRVILWLAEDQFKGIESLPQELLNQRKRGLEIRFCDDLKSHKKYYYVIRENPEDLIVLVDDDMFYPYDMIEQLLKMHQKYPKDICATTAQVITESFSNLPSKWRNPRVSEVWEHSDQIQVFTGSGSLFPPHVLPEEAFDKNKIQLLCPYADDLWLTFMAYLNNKKITALYKWRAFPVMIYGTAKDGLYYINAEAGQNDKQWENLLNYYHKES